MQRCPSGLRCSPGKAVCGKPHQEFESPSLRQKYNIEEALMFENYYKIKDNIKSTNDSAFIKCLRCENDSRDLFCRWLAKEMNLPINNEKVLQRAKFIQEQKIKLEQIPNKEERNQLLDFLARLLSAKFSGSKQPDVAISLTIDKLVYCFVKHQPIIFVFGFGGYKNYNSPSFPEVDWAELFHMKYMTTFLFPIISSYKYGVIFEYESEEISIQFNNVPQETTDKYTSTFKKLLDYYCRKVSEQNGVQINFKQVIARDLYNPQSLYNKMKEYYPEMRKIFDELSDEEKEIWYKRAKTNFMIKGINDYSSCNDEQLKNLIIDARINNECFLAADYELRIDFWERPNAISLFGTWGKSPCASPTDGGLHLKSTASSNTDFWIGTGIFKLNEHGDILQEQILSHKQYAEIKSNIKFMENTEQELSSISKNFATIKYID